MEHLTMKTSRSLILVPAVGTIFLLLDCHANLDMIVFASSYYFILLFVCYILEACFLMKDRKGVGLEERGGREELKGGGGTIIRIDCKRKESMSNKQEKWENEGKESSESLTK